MVVISRYGILHLGAFCQLTMITLYLRHLLPASIATIYGLYGAYASMMFALPLLGGYVAERFGYKLSVLVGLGFCLLAVLGLASGLRALVFVALAVYLVGNALYNPSMLCLIDAAYTKDDVRREAGFTINYLLFNLGGLFGIFFGGWLNQYYSYRAEFTVEAFILILSILLTLFSFKKLRLGSQRSIESQLSGTILSLTVSLIAIAAMGSYFALVLLHHYHWNIDLQVAFGVLALGFSIGLAWRAQERSQRNKIIAFLLLNAFSIIFWTFYNLEPSLLSVFINSSVNHQFQGLTIPADAFPGFDSVFVIIFGLLLNRIWLHLAKQQRDLSIPMKFAFGMLLVGMGWFLLWAMMQLLGFDVKYAFWWIVAAYGLWTLGELFIGPIGFSMVGRLAPQGYEGFFMGIWQFTIGIGAILSSLLASATVLPRGVKLAVVNQTYGHLFLLIGVIAMVSFSLLAIIKPWIKRLL